MITVNLEKSLVRNKRKLLTSNEILVLDQMEKIENNSEIERLRSKLGMWEDNSNTASTAKKKLSLYDKYPSDRIFTHADIKKLCITYGLRFLPSNLFNGELDSELPKKIKYFESKYNLNATKYNSFIVAPAKSFKLSKKPVDPLFFIQVGSEYGTESEKHYLLVHKWGNDISVLRWLANFPISTSARANLLYFSFWFILGCCIGYGSPFTTIGSGFLFSLLSALLLLMGKVTMAMVTGNLGMPYLEGNDEKWNSKFE